MSLSTVAAAKAEIKRLEESMRALAATTIARWWRSLAPRLAHARDVGLLSATLKVSAAWSPVAGKAIKAIVVLNLLCDKDPRRAASGIDESAQLLESIEHLKATLTCPVFTQTFRRGPNYKTTTELKSFIKSCDGGAVHVVVTGHGGVTWAHFLGKALVPHVSFLAPHTKGVTAGAIWSLSRPAILKWVEEYMNRHDYKWVGGSLSVSLDICQICADLATPLDGDSAYVAGAFEVNGKAIHFRGPVHAAFSHEMRETVPAFFLESSSFGNLVKLVSENRTLRERVAELEAQDLSGLNVSISSLIGLLDASLL
jgi:hypothetical protein